MFFWPTRAQVRLRVGAVGASGGGGGRSLYPLGRLLADYRVAVIAGACLIALLGAVVFYKAAFHEAVAVDPFGLYSLLVGTYLVSRLAFSAFYRPGRDHGSIPRVAIVMPSFNEEEAIGKSLRSLLELDYPQDKLEIVAVNDGSTDKTHDRDMQRVAAEAPLCG